MPVTTTVVQLIGRHLLSHGGAAGAEQSDEHRLRDGGLLDLHMSFLVVAIELGRRSQRRPAAYHLKSGGRLVLFGNGVNQCDATVNDV